MIARTRRDWRKATEQLFGEEIATDPFRAKKAYDSQPSRSTLVTHTGYRLLLGN
jgi:hypothetical protein